MNITLYHKNNEIQYNENKNTLSGFPMEFEKIFFMLAVNLAKYISKKNAS